MILKMYNFFVHTQKYICNDKFKYLPITHKVETKLEIQTMRYRNFNEK